MGLADVIYRQLNQEYGDVSNRENVQWQPLDDRRKNFARTIDFNEIEKKNNNVTKNNRKRKTVRKIPIYTFLFSYKEPLENILIANKNANIINKCVMYVPINCE